MVNKCCSVNMKYVGIFARYVQCWKGYIGNKPRYCNLLCGLCSKVHRDLLFLWEISKLAKNPAHLDSDLGVVMDDNDDDLYVMDDNDDATQFDVCLGAESPLSANLTKLPNLSLPQLQSVNLPRFDLNIRCAAGHYYINSIINANLDYIWCKCKIWWENITLTMALLAARRL